MLRVSSSLRVPLYSLGIATCLGASAFAQSAPQDDVNPAPTFDVAGAQGGYNALGSVIVGPYDVQTPNAPFNSLQVVGVEYAFGFYWISQGDGSTLVNSAVIDQYTTTGGFIAQFPQNSLVTSTFNNRDGEAIELTPTTGFLYFGEESNRILEYSWDGITLTNTRTLIVTNPGVGGLPSIVRSLARDPVTGLFYTANFGSAVFEMSFDASPGTNATVTRVFPNPTLPTTAFYGMAWDTANGTLCGWSQNGVPACRFDEFTVPAVGTTLTFTGKTFQGAQLPILSPLAGGADIYSDTRNCGSLSMIGFHQSTPDAIVLYDIATSVPIPPVSETNASPGTLIPAVGSGGTGTWPGTFPPNETVLTVASSCPISCVDKITINNPTHSWVGDTQFVLEDPAGNKHNLLVRPGFTGTGFGSNGDFVGGSIEIVDPTTLGVTAVPQAGNIAAGTYGQNYGAWPDGTSGTFNTPLRLISGPAGTWTLRIYDWAAGDTGLLDGFTLDANTCDYTTATYCTAKINSLGCTPAIGFSGTPSATAGSGFFITASNLLNQKNGLLVYANNGEDAIPFQGGTLCVKQPSRRCPFQSSGGSHPSLSDCSGTYSRDMNLFAVGGGGGTPAPFLTSVGAVVNAQWWSRDTGFSPPNASNLTDAVQYYVGP